VGQQVVSDEEPFAGTVAASVHSPFQCEATVGNWQPRACWLSELGPASRGGGEWLWWMVWRAAPWMPGLIWVRDLAVGDVMVDGSVHLE
jgi:hypothetical protein